MTHLVRGVLVVMLILVAEVYSDVPPEAGASGVIESALSGPAPAPPVDDEALNAVVRRTCVMCHNDRLTTGNLSLQHFDISDASADPEVSELMIGKLRLDMMPPPGVPRPGGDTLVSLVQTLEERMDQAAAAHPNPGNRLPQRLNQVEYRRSIRDLLGVEVDPSAYLPPETISDNFDNIADVQSFSPALLEGYMRAAGHVARTAVGNPAATPVQITYRVPQTTNQRDRLPGAPYGSRGGIVAEHNFPADGEYAFRLEFHAETEGNLFGRHARGEQIELSLNGERLMVQPIDRWMWERDPEGLTITTDPFFIPAGPHTVAAVFIPTSEGPINDLMSPIEHTLADLWITRDLGITTIPHLRGLRIDGPYDPVGVSSTPSRDIIFTCHPEQPSEQEACARSILERLATKAYRRPVSAQEMDDLMPLYREAAARSGFESGVRLGLQAILSSPNFIFRLDRQPADVEEGEIYSISSTALASRLSYFLWATPPDEELLRLAAEDRLQDPVVLEEQVVRMLEDPRAESLATRFAAQWLRLPRLAVHRPDAVRYPQWDDRLREAAKRETELFFYNLVREDGSLLDLLTADYTFVNERLARHYGMEGIVGNEFRRVQVTDPRRAGLGVMGHASILSLSSHANRTSPVDRGLWVMEILLGSEPPPPPPNVPPLESTDGEDDTGRTLTVRERLEMHRASPSCNSCHQFIDPLGLPLENWDPTGLWRIRDSGSPLDTRGELWNGLPVETPQDLRDAVLSMEIAVVRNFTSNMLRYALGRRTHHYDAPAVRQIARQAAANDYRMSSFILGVVLSDPFRMQRGDRMADAPDEGALRHQ